MDFAALLEPVIKFFSEGIGKIIADVARAVYEFLYPSNAPAAHPIEIPR